MQESTVEYTQEQLDFEVKYLSASDLKVAASILYNAYFDDPLFCHIFKREDEGYDVRLRGAIREELNTYWEAKQPLLGVYKDGSLVAATCLINPEPEFGDSRYWHWRLKMLLTAGFVGTQQFLEKEKMVREHLPAQKCHMIAFIGVQPNMQNQGIGHILLAAVNELVDAVEDSQGVGIFVTLNKCLPFFDDCSFELIEKLETVNIKGQILYKKKQG
ncbi:MAG: GNAT family N-acetyltransferase [Glaciecola sp.]|nr:GNAT family N-acetyltransferase [Glaciecola sp.]MDG1816329.1 GNAT family N-acetyltransferase [Glaciecola sp.]MDG2100241.1 GNAT family N-acetyltransferase [Glaciecola sp.]